MDKPDPVLDPVPDPVENLTLDNYHTTVDTVKVFSMNDCPYCDKAIDLLNRYNFNLEIIKVNKKIDRIKIYEKIEEETGEFVHTFPQICFDKEWIGGWDELCKKFKSITKK